MTEVGKTAQQAAQGDVDAALLRSLNMSSGILFHYPAGQVQHTVDGVAALFDGDSSNPLLALFGKPKK